MQTISCHHCHHVWTYESVLGRRDECPACAWDAHVCLNCIYYDPKAHHECREPQADYVKEKDDSNFCDYFSPNATGKSQLDASQKALSDLASLFGQPATPSPDSQDASSAKPPNLEDELKKFLGKK